MEETHHLGDVERAEPYEICSATQPLPSEPGNAPCPIVFSDLNITGANSEDDWHINGWQRARDQKTNSSSFLLLHSAGVAQVHCWRQPLLCKRFLLSRVDHD